MCQICGKRNHTTIKCWSIFDHSIQPEEEQPQALAALNINEEHDPALYADSSTTTHIMNHTGKILESLHTMVKTHYMLAMVIVKTWEI